MYWIPKNPRMHKNPTGARFTIPSKKFSSKLISRSVPMLLISYTPKLKISMKMLNSYQIIIIITFSNYNNTYKILTPSFSD